MSSIAQALEFKVGLDLSQVSSGLASVGAQASKALAPATTGTTALTVATTRLTSAHDHFSDTIKTSTPHIHAHWNARQALLIQSPDLIAGFLMGGLNLQYMALQGLQVIEMIGGMERAYAVLLPMLGPLAVGVAAAATAWTVFANANQKAEQELTAFHASVEGTYQAVSPERIQEADLAFRGLADTVADATTALYLETGALTSMDVEQMKAVESVREAARAKILLTAAQWAGLEVQRQEIAAQLQTNKLNLDERLAGMARIKQLNEELPAARARLDALKEEVNQQASSVNATYNQIIAHKAETEAIKEKTKAKKEDTETFGAKELAEQVAASDKATKEQEAQDIARFEAKEKLRQDNLTLDREYQAKQLADEKKRAAAEAALDQQRMASAIDSTQAILGAAESGFADLSTVLADSGKRGAMAAFVASKVAAGSQIALSGIVALAKVWELGPLAVVPASIAVGAAFAGFAAQIAAAEPPAFPTGGLVASRMMPGHTTIQARPTEGIVSTRGMRALGRGGLDAINRGEAPASSPVVIGVPVFGAARAYQRDELRRSGPLRRALAKASRTSGRRGW